MSDDTNPTTENHILPERPVETLETLGAVIERIMPEVMATLGGVCFEGATAESQAWIDRLNDAAERIGEQVSRVFPTINATPIYYGEEDTEPVVQPKDAGFTLTVVSPEDEAGSPVLEKEAPKVSHEDLLLVKFFLMHPEQMLSRLRSELSAASGWSSEDFTRVREGLVERLAACGVKAKWVKGGTGTGTHYTLKLIDGRKIIQEALFEYDEMPGSSGDEALEAAMQPNPIQEIFEDSASLARIVAFIQSKGRATTNEITQSLLGATLYGEDFRYFCIGLEGLVEDGMLTRTGKTRFAANTAVADGLIAHHERRQENGGTLKLVHTDGRPKKANATAGQASLDQRLKQAGIHGRPRVYKPKQRNRGWDR